MKSTLLDGNLQLNLTAFSYKSDDMQLGLFDPVTTSLKVVNAAKSKVEGVEFETNWATPVEGLTVHGSLDTLDASSTSICPIALPARPSRRVAICMTPHSGLVRSTNRMLLAGRWCSRRSGAVPWLEYETPISDALNLSITGYATYSDEYEAATDYIVDTAQELLLDDQCLHQPDDLRWPLGFLYQGHQSGERVVSGPNPDQSADALCGCGNRYRQRRARRCGGRGRWWTPSVTLGITWKM